MAMGVLDDAIREHLDLKRARGGDPAEIERMEREALGPVRREPTIGSGRIGALDEHPAAAPASEVHEDHLTDLEEMQEQGYHDSTAPHPHAHHEHPDGHHGAADEHFGLEHGDRFAEAPEQPRRRFLRRNRSAPDQRLPDPGFPDDRSEFDPLDPGPIGYQDAPRHTDALGHPDPLDYHDPLVEHEPLAHAEPPVEPFVHDEPAGYAEPLEHPTAEEQVAPPLPPHLQFEHPPKRPRFSTEPPALQDAAAEPAAAPEEQAEGEVQETTEFDVQKHIAETRHQPDEQPPAAAQPPEAAPPAAPQPAAPQPPATATPPATPQQPPASGQPIGEQAAAAQPPADEDVLEETPEFLQDTPEHDRLWFEQRPPKDFDFDG
jgi:hypothetical protein